MSEYRNHKPMEVLTSNHYSKHVSAMTEEDLYSKAEIAEELAVRDMRIDGLLSALKSLHDQQNGPPLERYRAQWADAMAQAEEAIAKAEASK